MQKSLSRWWLIIGVASLAISGLLALVLVGGRSPLFASPFFNALFYRSLVVHVDLSVLVWFLAVACLLWSLMAEQAKHFLPFEMAGLISFGLGTLLLAASAFDNNAVALMSNYIPVITSPIFFLGLGLIFCGVLLMLAKLFTVKWEGGFDTLLRFGIASAGWIAVVCAIAFYWSHHQMPSDILGQEYYDVMFWGGGHLLQFVHTQILMVVWVVLMRALCDSFNPPRKLLYALFGIGVLAALAVPLAYLQYPIESPYHRMFFTRLMTGGNGLAPSLMIVMLVPGLWNIRGERSGQRRALWACLITSVLLFIYGGILGELVAGQNVVIPAHYHGSIVGITLAFMGLSYLYLPRFGWRYVADSRLAFWQPIIYAAGQFLHISGLAWSGGYGVLRKTPGGFDTLEPTVRAALGIMGIGGVLAIIGGFLFVFVIAKAAWKNA